MLAFYIVFVNRWRKW